MKYWTAVLIPLSFIALCFSCHSDNQAINSRKIDSLAKLAIVTDSLQDLPASIKYYTEILKLDSTNLLALTNRGRALVWSGEVDKGIADYDKTIRLYPDERTYYARGMLYISLLRYDKALPDLRKSVKLNQDYTEPYYGLAMIYANRDNLDSALLLCKAADEISYRPDFSHYIRTTVFRNKGDFKGVVTELNESIKLDSTNAGHYNDRGLAKNELKQYKEAIVDFDIAIKLEPEMAFAYNNKAFSLMKLNQFDKALSMVNTSLELDSKNAYALKNRGEIFFALSSKDKACEDLMAAIHLSRDKDLTEEIELLLIRICSGELL